MFKIHESNRAAIADINSAKVQVNQAENEVALKARQLYYGILIAQLREQAASGRSRRLPSQAPGEH
jgi:outer membrane protein TolC